MWATEVTEGVLLFLERRLASGGETTGRQILVVQHRNCSGRWGIERCGARGTAPGRGSVSESRRGSQRTVEIVQQPREGRALQAEGRACARAGGVEGPAGCRRGCWTLGASGARRLQDTGQARGRPAVPHPGARAPAPWGAGPRHSLWTLPARLALENSLPLRGSRVPRDASASVPIKLYGS